jgi:purine nucleosidase
LITKEKVVYMDVELSHGATYGDTLTWTEQFKPATGVRLVHAQVDLDLARFQKMFVTLMTSCGGVDGACAPGGSSLPTHPR